MWMCNVDVRGKEKKRKLQIVIDNRDRAVTFDLFSVSRSQLQLQQASQRGGLAALHAKRIRAKSMCSVYPYRTV